MSRKQAYTITLIRPAKESTSMGLQFQWFIEITDTNTGQKFKQELKGPIVNYDLILSIIQSYSPQADFQTITLYYWKYNSWRMFLKSDFQDLDCNHVEFETHPNSNQVLMQVRYHCEYFLQNEQEDLIKEDLHNMNQKIAVLQKMYQQLREKYIQEAIDINVFWGSPLFAEDTIIRNRKGMNIYQHLNKVEYQLLANQVKYTPYINAVTEAINTCNNKKVQLFLNPLNLDSFKKKNVFTITYIMSHVEIYQQDRKEKKDTSKNFRKDLFSKTYSGKSQKAALNPRLLANTNNKQKQRQIEEKPSKIPDLCPPPLLEKQDSYKGEQIEMVVEESVSKSQLKLQSTPEIAENSIPTQMAQSKSENFKVQLKQSIVDILVPPEEIQEQNGENSDDEANLKIQSTIQVKQKRESNKKYKGSKHKPQNRKRYTQPKVYMLGQRLDGGLCKITPEDFKKMFDTVKTMDLLILHTSYPDYHLNNIKDVTEIRQVKQLKSFKECAKNIILINSNPVCPEPSTIYYIKKFFTHLLQSGKISQSYQKALNDLDTLKGVSLQLRGSKLQSKNRSINHFYDQKQVQFINKMNQKWVHGSMEGCCCYHPHKDNCKSKENNRPSKFAQFHYLMHTIHCDCPRDHLMIHSCEQKQQIMKKYLQVFDKHADFKEFYFCCCGGYELGYYRKLKNNRQTDYNPHCPLNQQRDMHSLRFKYKFEKKMPNQQKFQFQIFDGHSKGNIGKHLMDSFNYLDKNSLIGNATVIIDLLEVYTKANDQEYNICNLIGTKRTGRKAIAKYFANLIVVKQVFQKYVIKNVGTSDSLASIIKKEQQNQQQSNCKAFFIFIFNQKYYNNSINISKATFGRPVSAIIISQQKVKVIDSSLKVQFMQPKPFQHSDCLSYVKMYKHLKPSGKRNLQALFTLAKKGFDNSNNYKLYPCELNQFQILNIVTKTSFTDYKIFQPALGCIHPNYIHYYLFLMSVIKFTTTPSVKFDIGLKQKQANLQEFQKWLIKLQQNDQLFYKDYDTIRQSKISDTSSSFSLNVSQKKEPQYDVRQYKNQIINFERLRQHYYLIYACTGSNLKPHLTTLLKMFINYSTLIPFHKFNEDKKLERVINRVRIKNLYFVDQVYQTTTINNNSYISRYFKEQLSEVYHQFAVYQQKAKHTELQQFLKIHSQQLQKSPRLTSRKTIDQNYSKPKQKQKRNLDPYYSTHQQSPEFQRPSASEHHQKQQPNDIPNIYHLASVVEAGLQFIRSIISTHFIYSRMNDTSKIDFLRFGVLLVNNCIILLKNKAFAKIKQNFDLDSGVLYDFSSTNMTNKIYENTHRYNTPVSPHLQNIKSHDQQLNIPSVNRTYSGKQILNTQRQFSMIQTSAAKSTLSDIEQQQEYNKSDQFLLKELYRLSTYKGLLYLLSQMERRCDEISDKKKWTEILDQQKIPRIRVAIQLLGIQVRLQQLNLQSEQTRIPQNSPDRHLARIHQVFTQKNYNIISLKRILRQEITIHSRFPKDKQQLGIIKSHIIVALALMSSCYGKFKLVRGNFMIQQIDEFIDDWNQEMPLNRRESQQDGEAIQTQPATKMHKNHSIFAFMRVICQNQSVYLHIIQSFNSVKFWPEESKDRQNEEVNLFTKLLRLFHLFTLKNTKNKKEFYKKLQFIQFKINQEFKDTQHSSCFSTYIQNFKISFLNSLKKEMNKLAPNLILILTAQSDATEHDIKMSISQRIQELLQKKSKEIQYFCLKKELNITNLQRLCNGYKCNYLFIYTSPLKDDEKSICVQNNEKKGVCPTEKIVQLLTRAVFKVLFVCLPKKKSLAQMLVQNNVMKRIVYFDFAYNNFTCYFQKAKDELLIFQKMIMVTIVTKLMKTIIEKELHNTANPIPQSFSQIACSLGFLLIGEENPQQPTTLIKITNAQIRKCLLMSSGGDNIEYSQKKQSTLKLYQKDRIKPSHLAVIERFTKKTEEKLNDKKVINIQLPPDKEQFSEVLSFYFREKLSFHQIFRINLDQLKSPLPVQPQKGGKKDNNANFPSVHLKSFYQKLTADKILQHIFSNKRVILTLYFKQYDRMVVQCQGVLQQIMEGFQQDYSNRKKKKFIGYKKVDNKKQVPQIIFYFFDYQEKHEPTEFQYMVL